MMKNLIIETDETLDCPNGHKKKKNSGNLVFSFHKRIQTILEKERKKKKDVT